MSLVGFRNPSIASDFFFWWVKNFQQTFTLFFFLHKFKLQVVN